MAATRKPSRVAEFFLDTSYAIALASTTDLTNSSWWISGR